MIDIENLLALESEAQQAMKDIGKENTFLTNKATADLAARLVTIENEGAEAIRRIARETDNFTATRLAEIGEEYRRKTENFQKEFNTKIQRGRIFHDVVHGGV